MLAFASCVKDIKISEPINLDPHHITKEQAIKNMYSFMNELYGRTRSLTSGFTYPTDAMKFFREQGYNSLDHPGWNTERENLVLTHLRAGRPVLMSAVCNVVGGHTWVFDGFKYTDLTINVAGFNMTFSALLLHCNWGWGGASNGYFISGLFDESNRIDLDDVDSGATSSGHQHNFDHLSRLVTAVPK